LNDNGATPNELARVDQYTLCDLPQHELASPSVRMESDEVRSAMSER
jgi:hypothetical protein